MTTTSLYEYLMTHGFSGTANNFYPVSGFYKGEIYQVKYAPINGLQAIEHMYGPQDNSKYFYAETVNTTQPFTIDNFTIKDYVVEI